MLSLHIYHVLNLFSKEECSESVSSNLIKSLLRSLWPQTALLLSVSGGQWGLLSIPALGDGVSKATSYPQQSLCKSVPIRDKLSWSVCACPVEEQAPAFSSPNFCPLLCGRGGQGYKRPLLWLAQMVLRLLSSLTVARPNAEKHHNFKLVLLHCKKLEVCVLFTQSHLTLCYPTNYKPIRLLCPWNSPSKNTGVGCHSLLQEIFLTQDQTPVYQLQVDCLLLEEARRPPMKCYIYDSKKKYFPFICVHVLPPSFKKSQKGTHTNLMPKLCLRL